jgi:uncharacterized Zn-binding protein involved in type VI secretion
MPGISRKDTDTAGGTIIEGSGTVFVENKAVVRIGDAVAGHGIAKHAAPKMETGSGTVFANGIAVCRAGDTADCGDAATGSGTVSAG